MEAANQYSYAKVEYDSQKQALSSLQSYISESQTNKLQLEANNSLLEAKAKQLKSESKQSEAESNTLRGEHLACSIKTQKVEDNLDKSKKTNDLFKVYEDSGKLVSEKAVGVMQKCTDSVNSLCSTQNISVSYNDGYCANRIYEKLILQDSSYKNELDKLQDINFISSGSTVLIHALQLQNIKAIDTILLRNPDVNIINQEDGAIALNYSTLLPVNQISTYDINQYIVKNTANINHKTASFSNNTPLHNLTKSLIRVSESPGEEEETKECLTDLIDYFIQCGAEIDIKNSHGITVRELLADNNLLDSIDNL